MNGEDFGAAFETLSAALGLGPEVDGFTLTMMRARIGQPGEMRLRVAHSTHIADPSRLIEAMKDYDVILRKRLP